MLKRLLRDLVTYLPSKLLPAITGFITTPILTAWLVPAEYGNWALAAGLHEFLFALAVAGFGSGAVRFFPAYAVKSKLDVFFSTLGVSLGLVVGAVSVASFAVLWLIRGVLPASLYPLLLISVLIFAVRSISTVLMETVRAQERSRLYTISELLAKYGALGLGLLFLIVFDLGVQGLLWGEFGIFILVLPFLIPLTLRGTAVRPQAFQRHDAQQLWAYAWPLTIGNAAMWGLRLSDRYIIRLFRSGDEVGLYSVAYSISSKSVDILVALFILSVGPMVVNVWERQGEAATQEAMSTVTRLFLIFGLPAVVGLTVLAAPFVALLTSPAYQEGYRIVGYVAFSSFAWGLSQIVSRPSIIKKDTRRISINMVVAAAINLGLNLLLIPRIGFLGAGIATAVGYALLVVLQFMAARKHLSWAFPWTTLRNTALAAGAMGLIVIATYALAGDWNEAHVGYLLLSVVAGAGVYFVSLLLLGEARGHEKAAAEGLWHKLIARLRGPASTAYSHAQPDGQERPIGAAKEVEWQDPEPAPSFEPGPPADAGHRPRRVLMLAYVFPPFFSIGGSIRAVKFVKYLPALGWHPVVLTIDDSKEYATQRKEGSAVLLKDVPAEAKICRTTAGEPSEAFLERGRQARKRSPLHKLVINGLAALRDFGRHHLLQPDDAIAWLPFAVKTGRKLIREEAIDVIFATCPPFSVALTGAVLKRLTGTPLLLDFRDDWLDTPWYHSQSRLVRFLQRRMEQWAVTTSDSVVLVTEASKNAFCARYRREPDKFHLIPNGCDLEDFEVRLAGAGAASSRPKNDAFTIVHAGLISDGDGWRRNPRAFFEAVARLRGRAPELGSRVNVAFTGHLPDSYRQMIDEMGLSDVVKETGFLPQDAFLDTLRAADLLLAINYEGFSTLIPGKIYEYWAIGGPQILLLSCPGAAQDLIEQHNLGLVAEPDDAAAIEAAILRSYRQREAGERVPLSTKGIEVYSRQALTVRLAEALSSTARATRDG